MFSTVRCCLEWQRVQPEQPHRVDLYQPPLSLDRGLNCFQIFRMLYATISFALQRYMCRFFFFFVSVCLRSFIRKGQTFSTFKIFTLLLMIAINIRFCTIVYIRLQKTLFVYPSVSLSLSLFTSPLFQGGGGVRKMSVNVQTECAIVWIREKQKAEHYFVCSFPHACVEISLVDILNKIWCAGGVQAPN